jgi:hypothetical protein
LKTPLCKIALKVGRPGTYLYTLKRNSPEFYELLTKDGKKQILNNYQVIEKDFYATEENIYNMVINSNKSFYKICLFLVEKGIYKSKMGFVTLYSVLFTERPLRYDKYLKLKKIEKALSELDKDNKC